MAGALVAFAAPYALESIGGALTALGGAAVANPAVTTATLTAAGGLIGEAWKSGLQSAVTNLTRSGSESNLPSIQSTPAKQVGGGQESNLHGLLTWEKHYHYATPT